MAIGISFGQIIGHIIDSVNEIHEVVMVILGPLCPNLDYTISTVFLVPRSTLCDPVIVWNYPVYFVRLHRINAFNRISQITQPQPNLDFDT